MNKSYLIKHNTMKGLWIILLAAGTFTMAAQPGSSVSPPSPAGSNQTIQPSSPSSPSTNPNGNNQLNPTGQTGTVQPNATIQPGASINNSFNRDYKGATNTTWNRSGDNYSATYQYNGGTYNSTYNNSGTRLGTSTTIDPNTAPSNVTRSYQNGEYAKWKVGNSYQLTTPDNNTYYQYDISNGGKTKSIYYDSKGVMLQKRPY